MIDSFAAGCSLFPVGWIAQVVDPPRKGAALSGASFIDGALFVFKEDAVVGACAVEQRILIFDLTAEFADEIFRSKLEMVGEAV